MIFEEIGQILCQAFSGSVHMAQPDYGDPYLRAKADVLEKLAYRLHHDERLFFDQLSCITGVDLGKGAFDVVYQFNSIPLHHALMLKVKAGTAENSPIPTVPSLCHLWKSANWMERETFDLLGIGFTDHPDLRRILLPADWEGHPLRKDYQEQEYYHGIMVKY